MFDPKLSTITLKVSTPDKSLERALSKGSYPRTPSVMTLHSDEDRSPPATRTDTKHRTDDVVTDLDADLGELHEPPRVKLNLKAYLKLALHALKYANDSLPRSEWVEVIGLLTGHVEHPNTPLTCLVITDAYPIGHGTNVNAQIQDPQSMVKVYEDAVKEGHRILGWYHSHPSYSPFMSKTDFQTQVRYQRLGSQGSHLAAPIALVIDPTEISSSSYGFKIFRLRKDLRTWEEPSFRVLNCPLESLPQMIQTLLPLAEGKTMFLEYDHE
ncbi:MAG: Mov34/MPN/PAD-1 family protein [Candidatus Thorarchaeota archaeon]